MSTDSKFTLQLPKREGGIIHIPSSRSILFIGANGSGKTRLGTWVEFTSPQNKSVHRISAQKSLAMPDNTTPVSIEKAENDLLFGYADAEQANRLHFKQHNKFSNKPATSMLNDYQKLMVFLFSEHTEECAKYLTESKASSIRIKPPTTKLDKVKVTWEKILPHRELVVGGLRIQTKVKGIAGATYNSSEMSDGERVIFYLIGQCLAAPDNGIIVVDEPELHLHKSVQSPLWAEVEKLRPDCLFVYLTHDVDFASTLDGAQKIWLKSFDGNSWDWELIQQDDQIPNELLLEILGTRKPVLFVEGTNGSHDVSLYRELLPAFLVIPRGSCSQVIQSVRALKNNTQLHRLTVYGLIDKDRRGETEIRALEQDSIYVLRVAEVENIFCTKEVLQIVSQQLLRDPDSDFLKISEAIFGHLQQELDTQISLQVAGEIKYKLNNFNEKANGENALESALAILFAEIDVAALYSATKEKFNQVLKARDYAGLLSLYNRKSLPTRISAALDLKGDGLPEIVLRIARGPDKSKVTSAVKHYFGEFAKHMT